MAGPYVYAAAEKLEGSKVVGSRQCVALVQIYAHTGTTPGWRKGEAVKGNTSLAVGTAIATFLWDENRKTWLYPSHSKGNHAAFYVGQDAQGIYVIEQHGPTSQRKIALRLLKFRHGVGSPSDDGDAFSVIQ